MDEIADEFETWPDWLINLGIIFPWLLKKPLFDFVIHITHSVLMQSSWNLQIRWTWMKSRMNLKPGQIGSLTRSYIPLIAEKASVWLFHQHNSISFDPIFLKFADKVDMDKISHEFETWPDWIICLRFALPLLLKKKVFDFIISIMF